MTFASTIIILESHSEFMHLHISRILNNYGINGLVFKYLIYMNSDINVSSSMNICFIPKNKTEYIIQSVFMLKTCKSNFD